jgi:DNA-binding transcriptional LysR family regulator
MLDDIRALVQFAEMGSLVRAADRLHRTPSAVTRQIQRLENALGAELLDRSVKPPRLNSLGVRIVEQSREVLKRVRDLRAVAAQDGEPSGLLRIGVSHALADGTLVEPVRRLSTKFARVRLQLSSELTKDLFDRLLKGQLELAAVILPEGSAAPEPLLTTVITTDRMLIVRRRAGRRRSQSWQEVAAGPWILNPPGCLLRASLLAMMRERGVSANVTAEIHNMHLQLAFVAEGCGFGLLPKRFVERHRRRAQLQVIEPPGFVLSMTIAVARAGPLGSLEQAAAAFGRDLQRSFAHRGN